MIEQSEKPSFFIIHFSLRTARPGALVDTTIIAYIWDFARTNYKKMTILTFYTIYTKNTHDFCAPFFCLFSLMYGIFSAVLL